jgi:hypothetical protein
MSSREASRTRKASLVMAAGSALLASPVLAVEFKCVGEEKGINSLTGAERVIPVTLHVKILGKKATLQELAGISFAVKESRRAYTLEASLGARAGEYQIRIDKDTGLFNGNMWLLSRANASTQQGKCEEINAGE